MCADGTAGVCVCAVSGTAAESVVVLRDAHIALVPSGHQRCCVLNANEIQPPSDLYELSCTGPKSGHVMLGLLCELLPVQLSILPLRYESRGQSNLT